jgi:hypothetical protein
VQQDVCAVLALDAALCSRGAHHRRRAAAAAAADWVLNAKRVCSTAAAMAVAAWLQQRSSSRRAAVAVGSCHRSFFNELAGSTAALVRELVAAHCHAYGVHLCAFGCACCVASVLDAAVKEAQLQQVAGYGHTAIVEWG